MGHGTVTVSQRYVHPSPEFIETALSRLEDLNQSKRRGRNESEVEGGHKLSPVEVEAEAEEEQIGSNHYARVAKSADAKDLKSFGGQPPCGFKSHPGHHDIC